MKSTQFICFASVVLATILVACGGGTQPMGVFANISKTEGDVPFVLTAPTSKSPAAFTFTSSDPTVATISGSTVSIVHAGTTTITASQASQGSWSAGSTTAVLTVSAIACVAPATRLNGACSAPASSGNYVSSGSHLWMPVSMIDTWVNANTYCNTTTINGLTGWRLPNVMELTELFKNATLTGQGWVLGRTWSSTPGGFFVSTTATTTVPVVHSTADLHDGTTSDQFNEAGAYVACVR